MSLERKNSRSSGYWLDKPRIEAYTNESVTLPTCTAGNIKPQRLTGASPTPTPPLIENSTLVTFGVNPPSAAPLKFISGAYCTCSSAAHSLASAPPEYPHMAYRASAAMCQPNVLFAWKAARIESMVEWPDTTPAVKDASGPS